MSGEVIGSNSSFLKKTDTSFMTRISYNTAHSSSFMAVYGAGGS